MKGGWISEETEEALIEAGFTTVSRSEDQSSIYAVYGEDAIGGVNIASDRLIREGDSVRLRIRVAEVIDFVNGVKHRLVLTAVNDLNSRGFIGTWYVDVNESLVVDHVFMAEYLELNELVQGAKILALTANAVDESLLKVLGMSISTLESNLDLLWDVLEERAARRES